MVATILTEDSPDMNQQVAVNGVEETDSRFLMQAPVVAWSTSPHLRPTHTLYTYGLHLRSALTLYTYALYLPSYLLML